MKRIALIILLGLTFSCRSKNPSGEHADADMRVVAQYKKAATNDDMETFMVRIFPDKKFTEKGIEKMTESFQYHSDSCFYMLQGSKKIYPDYVEPVANGIKGCYEFLVGFNDQNSGAKIHTLVYQDQIINQKKYVLTIK